MLYNMPIFTRAYQSFRQLFCRIIVLLLCSITLFPFSLRDVLRADDTVPLSETGNNPSAALPCEQTLANALQSVLDPELRINIIDLGVVQKISCDQTDRSSRIDIIFTSPLCPYAKELVDAIKATASQALPGYSVSVAVDMKTRWNPSNMSQQARQRFWGFEK